MWRQPIVKGLRAFSDLAAFLVCNWCSASLIIDELMAFKPRGTAGLRVVRSVFLMGPAVGRGRLLSQWAKSEPSEAHVKRSGKLLSFS